MAVDQLAIGIAAAALLLRQQRDAADDARVPALVVDYLESMTAARWYEKGVLDNVVASAKADGPSAVLLAVQAWTLRSAWCRLADWWGQEHAGWHDADQSKRRAAGRDYESAADRLLATDARTLSAWWVGADAVWVDRWRSVSDQVDPQTCERAGLHAAELRLLAA